MEPCTQKFRKLREQYERRTVERTKEMVSLLEQFEDNPTDSARLRDLMRHFHGLAGSGANYGFPGVTSLGRQGEHECVALMKQDSSRSFDLSCLRALLDELSIQLSQPAIETDEPFKEMAKTKLKPIDILVLDDDRDTCILLAELLEQEAMLIRAVHTKTDGLHALHERVPDGVIVNVRLPDGCGYEFVEQLKSLPGGKNAAVLMISELKEFLNKVEAVRCGADGYFEKPIDTEALTRRLRHLLERQNTEGYRILCVEDDEEQAIFVRAALESVGYRVRVCSQPQRFEADLISFGPDLVLMDILLPGVSGYDLARYLRQDDTYAALPILFLTSQTQAQARLESMKAGGDDHLIKPVSPGLLRSTVAARIEKSRRLKSLMDRDGLTRLLTHAAFVERARALLTQNLRTPQRPSALAMIDLDHFKSVNDSYGHQVGDKVLISVSKFLQRRLRQTDIIGRLGGEEFAVVIDHVERETAFRLMSRLLQEFSAISHLRPDGTVFQVTCSAGLAMLNPETVDTEAWLKAADKALYAAKEAGRDRVICA